MILSIKYAGSLPSFIKPCFTTKSCLSHITHRSHSAIRTAKSLKKDDLLDLFNGQIVALRIPGFCPQEVVRHALANLDGRKIVEYSNAEGVGKIQGVGMAYFEATDEEKKDLYYCSRLTSIRTLRDAFAPYLSPIDSVRVSLDEEWPCGSSLLNLGRGPMFVGIVRAIAGGRILPHEDKLERDDPDAFAKVNYVSQAAFNIYLSLPETGGELQIWNFSLTDQEYDRLRGNSYGINPSLLPPPTYSLKPEVGEWIGFNGRLVHAVNWSDERRAAVSGFILNQGANKPLKLWS